MIIKCDFGASSSDLFPLGTFLSVLLRTINLYNVENIINILTRYRESCRSSATYDLWLKAES